MQDGKRAIDRSVVYWIVVRENQYDELREVVSNLGHDRGQENMYLERTGSTIDFRRTVVRANGRERISTGNVELLERAKQATGSLGLMFRVRYLTPELVFLHVHIRIPKTEESS